MESDPWLRIPAEDYEGHMQAAGQTAALHDLFSDVYAERKPARLAVLGCTTGSDFRQVDPAVSEIVVGVDINREYLDIARLRSIALGSRLHLIHGDVLTVELPPAQFDLIHAALLLEYVDQHALFRRIRQWLAPGGVCSVVTQDPTPGVASVSSTGYESLQALGSVMRLRTAEEVAGAADEAGLRLVRQRAVSLANGKRLVLSVFEVRECTSSV